MKLKREISSRSDLGCFPGKTVQKNSNFINQLSKNVPMGRIGKPEELLGPVLFLLSSASSYITGQNIVVDGGQSKNY